MYALESTKDLSSNQKLIVIDNSHNPELKLGSIVEFDKERSDNLVEGDKNKLMYVKDLPYYYSCWRFRLYTELDQNRCGHCGNYVKPHN